MPSLIAAAGHAGTFDPTVMRWEQHLFGAQPAVQWATRWSSLALSEVLHAAYLAYYAIIFAVPVALYVGGRRDAFGEATFVLMLTFVGCFLFYIAFPVAGPRYFLTPAAGSPNGPIRSVALLLLEARSSRGTAFPSSHVAVAVAQSILAVRYFGKRGAGIAVLSLGLAVGAVYGGFHFVVDVLAGIGFGAATTVTGLVAYARLTRGAPLHANANAPT
jgi:membrane-associated phospholipid phosphatase